VRGQCRIGAGCSGAIRIPRALLSSSNGITGPSIFVCYLVSSISFHQGEIKNEKMNENENNFKGLNCQEV
jgi:hypothetical protein